MRVFLATTCSADDRKTLAAARCLAQHGAQVTVGGDEFWGLAFWSRSVGLRLRYPHPGKDLGAFRATLQQLLTDHPHDVILPTNDYTTIGLASCAADLKSLVGMALPSLDDITRAHDKFAIAVLCGQLGIEVPATRLATSPEELTAAAAELGYPCVVKLRRGAGARDLRIVRGPEHWDRVAPATREADIVFDYQQFVVQEFVPGMIHDVCAIFHHGELRAAVTQCRLRTYPAAGGIGVDCVTTDEPELIDRAVVLMRALKWHGPAQIEFMVDQATGRVRLIEVNGRLWGTLALSAWAGVDIPWLLCRMVMDGDVEPHLSYRIGARYRWRLPLGVLHLWQSRSKWADFRHLVVPAPDTEGDWWWRDPGPHAAEALYSVRRMYGMRRLGPEIRQPVIGGHG